MPHDLDLLDADLRLCHCGCAESEHDLRTGLCMHCGPEQCPRFRFDTDSSLAALFREEEGLFNA